MSCIKDVWSLSCGLSEGSVVSFLKPEERAGMVFQLLGAVTGDVWTAAAPTCGTASLRRLGLQVLGS